MRLIKAAPFCLVLAVVLLLRLVESGVIIRFDRAPLPQSRFPYASFHYSVLKPDGSNACVKPHNCFFHCEIDGQTIPACSSGSTILKNLTANRNHRFLIKVTTAGGGTNSSSYNWFIDSVPPTASITTERSYTNAKSAAISITFSEPCTVPGGFKCTNTSTCGVLINGPAEVDASTFHMIKPDIKYSGIISFSSKSAYGRVVIRMVDNFCTDKAGNKLARTNDSVIVVYFDKRPVQVDLWTSVPSYEMKVDRVPRTVLATNKNEELEIFLDFSDPVVNSTKEIMSALNANAGEFEPIHGKTHDNRRFAFELRNVAGIEIVRVKLQSASIIGRTGTAVSSVAAISFMYDSTKPRVRLTTISPPITKESSVDIIVEFTKPVFGFQPSGVKVEGGRVTRCKELSKSLYSLRVLGTTRAISVFIPEGKANDIAGNRNLASNTVEIKQYSPPAISTALHSFVTAGLIATSLASAVLSLSSANLGAIGLLTSEMTDLAFSDPSRNILGMIGHLQVFVFSDWISANLPLEYSETTKGLQWLIPREKLPWEKEKMASYRATGPHNNLSLESAIGVHYGNPANYITALDFNRSPYLQQNFPLQSELQQNKSVKLTTFGQPLEPDEYSLYFLREEPPLALANKKETYTGWKDLEMNLFWLGNGIGGLISIHLLTLLFLRWRTGLSVQGTLSIPRFELFLLMFMLPCISQSSAFVIRDGTTKGIIVGTLLLSVPGLFILSVSMFLVMAIFVNDHVQYKQIKHTGVHQPWYTKLLAIILGEPTQGKWFYQQISPATFLLWFGFLFEDRKGPPVFVLVDQNELNRQTKWIGSGQISLGRMREMHFDNSNEEVQVSTYRKLVGCARSAYLILDLLRRVSFGILAGAYSLKKPSQSIIALTLTLMQLLYLLIFNPYIRRGVHVAESVSLLCEAGVFGLSLSVIHKNPFKEKTVGFIMLSLLFISFLSQLVNEWYALVRWLLKLPQPSNPSFKLGVTLVAKGFILPFLPRKYWLKLVPGSSRESTGVGFILPQSRETESARKNEASQHVDPSSSMTAKIVPVFSPESECARETRQKSGVTQASEVNGQKLFGLESRDELKKLRELAKASFVGSSKVGGSSSYGLKDQNGFNDSLPINSQASSPMKIR